MYSVDTYELNETTISPVREAINNARRICFITGAGVSVSAGIPDFQSTDNTWKWDIPRVEAVSIQYFKEDPESFWRIYADTFDLKSSTDIVPTDFHYWLSDLGIKHGKSVSIITQNVDGLHSMANSQNVIELHGSVRNLKCLSKKCRYIYDYAKFPYTDKAPRCPVCQGVLRPDVVLFGEAPHDWKRAETEVMNADVLITVGTSLNVAPLNTLPYEKSIRYPQDYQFYISKNVIPSDLKEYSFDGVFEGSADNFAHLLSELTK